MNDQKLNDMILDLGVTVLLKRGQMFLDQDGATPEAATRALYNDLMEGPMERAGLAALLSFITIGALASEDEEPADEPGA